jgi:hypothetical protein
MPSHFHTYQGEEKMNERNKTSIILFSIGAGMLFGAAATMSAPQYSMYFLFGSQFFIIAGAIASSANISRRFDEINVEADNARRDMYNNINSVEDSIQRDLDALRRELVTVEGRICTNKQKDAR